MATEDNTKIPPMVDLKVTNPVEYIKLWWKKIIGNEGVDFRIHFHPLTAIAIALAIGAAGFGIGRFVMPFSIPFFNYNQDASPTPSPTSKPEEWKETAFTGNLQYSSTTSKYFLTTTSASEAISLQVPNNIDLFGLIGKRILVIGDYNKNQRIFIVNDAKDMEVLPKSPNPVPTTSPTPSASPSPTPTTEPSPSTTPSPTPES